jgi:stage V sporulation protein D (sporulation-specific penicillin-binding protein)
MVKKSNETVRITIFLAAVCAVFGLIGYRLFVLSYVRHSAYARTAEAQTDNINNILARGNIYFSDKDGAATLAATNRKFPAAHIVASKVDQSRADTLIASLAEITGAAPETLAKVIGSHAVYARVVAKRLTADQVARIKALNAPGIGISYEMDRFYPYEGLASDVLGFLGYNGTSRSGQYGIESFYDTELFGKSADTSHPAAGIFARLASVFGKKTDTKKVEPTFDRPKDIVLTIDKNVQSYIEDRLEQLLHQWSAAGGSVIVEDPRTGKIIAMADRPTFNPNNYSDFPTQQYLNNSLQQVFEPGSSFKPITMAAGLDLGKVTPQTSYEDTGSVSIAGYTIKNFSSKVFGHSTMSQVLEKSINTGTMFVENLIGDDNFLNYTINMGFGQRTGIDLPGEVSGDITNLYSGRKINYLTASFGQGIAVTPLQLVNAYATLANGGKLMRPYVVDKIVSEGGRKTMTKPEIAGMPISEKTASKIKTMLVSVVDNGFDKARIKGYDIAGKTGTAQIPDGQGGYLENQYIHSFLGFAPAYDARFVILIKMDKPQGITFAADSLSPAFRDIAAFLINYYNIPPTRQ